MTTQEIADQLVSLCREGKYEEVYQKLFSPEIVSREPEGSPWPEAKGFEQLSKKASQWQEMVAEFHSGEVSDPIVADHFFACTMKSKVTFKGEQEPRNMNEVCVYQVAGGKVVLEQFFYTPTPG